MASIYFASQTEVMSNIFLATFGVAPGATYLAAANSLGTTAAAAEAATAAILIDFTGQTTAAGLATVLLSNWGLTTVDAAAGNIIGTYVTGLFAAGVTRAQNPNAGATLVSLLNAYSGLANLADPAYAAYATAATNYNLRLETGVAYSLVATNNSTDLTTLAAVVAPTVVSSGQTFTLTTGMDTVTTAYSTVNAIIDQLTTGTATTWGLTDTVTTSAGGTLNLTLLSNTTAATAAVRASGYSTSGLTTANIKVVDGNSGADSASAFNVSGMTGLTTLNIANSSVSGGTSAAGTQDTLTITGLASTTKVGINTNGQYQNVTLTGADWTGAADTLTLNVTGRSGAVALTTGVETLAIVGGTGARLESLRSVTTDTVKAVTVTGSDLRIGATLDLTVATFDASAATGTINVILTPGTTLTSAKGGTGTADVLTVNSLGVTTTLAGFETLNANTAATYDLTNAVGVTTLGVTGTGVAVFTNAAATQNTVKFVGSGAAAANETLGGATYGLKTATGIADALTLAVNNGATANTKTLTVGAITANAIESITITEADWTGITFGGFTDALTSTGNLTFKASGASNLALGSLTITTGLATGTNTYDFSGQTGTLSATVADTSAANLAWTGGTGVETITTGALTAAANTATYTMGNAANVITIANPAKGTTTITGGTADDTFVLTAGSAIAGTATSAGLLNINGGTSTSTSQNTLSIQGTGAAFADTINSFSNIQKVLFQEAVGTGATTVNATVATGYADIVGVTFVGNTGDILNINAAAGGTASLANYTVLGTGILKLTGTASTLTGAATATTFVSGVGADVMTGGAGVDSYLILQANSNSTAGIDTISNFVAGTDVLRLTTAGAGVVNVGGAGAANVSNNAVAVASTGTSVATLLANLSTAATAQNVLSPNSFVELGDTFSVQITGASLCGTNAYYVVQNDGANTTVTAADTIVALIGTSTAAITVATITV